MNSATASWVGERLASGRYRVDEKLGAGGMGAVYRARDDNLNADVVIKVPHPHMLEDEAFSARFRREIRALVSLSHPHVVKILDVGEHESVPFAVMQYLGGGSLEGRLTPGKPVAPASLAEWMPDVVNALDFIHRKGFVHRDIKPANIFFDAERIAYVGDFGIAKVFSDLHGETQTDNLTGTGLAMGTVDYMAPEVLLNEPYDGRADQYALAVMLCEMLSGRRPFRATTPVAVIAEKVAKEPTKLSSLRSDLPSGLASAIDRGMSKKPKRRYATCSEFAHAVLLPPKNDLTLIKLSCPSCSRTLRLKPKAAGKCVSCPNCKARLTVAADLSKLHGPPPSTISPPPQQPTPPSSEKSSNFIPPPFTEPVHRPETAPVVSGPTPSSESAAKPSEGPRPWMTMARQSLRHPTMWVGGGVVLLIFVIAAMMVGGDGEDTQGIRDDYRQWTEEFLAHNSTEGFIKRVAHQRIGIWRVAAERGIPEAQALYADCFWFGIAVPQDDAEAVKWYRKAALQDYPAAQFNLGVCYREGRGVPN